MGIDSYIFIGYGFRIPESEYGNLLIRQEEDTDELAEGDMVGDNVYTHEICPGEVYFYGKIIHTTEARSYIWDGNRQVLDLRKDLKIHHMQKRKIDDMAKRLKLRARYFAVGVVE